MDALDLHAGQAAVTRETPRAATGPRHSLLWLLFVSNAAVLTVATGLLAALPVTVSWPVTERQVGVLAIGLVVTLMVNLLATRRLLHPLERLRAAMRSVDPLSPGRRIDVSAGSVEVAELSHAYNDMLDRLEFERRESARRAQAAQEAERRAISLELHDEVGQNLTALLLQLDLAARLTESQRQEAIEAAQTTARSTLEVVRSIAHGLRPEALDDLGLVRALSHLCERMSQGGGPPVACVIDADLPRLSADAELVVYRVAQECLTNAARHAGAGQVTVTLARAAGGVHLRVSDDGVGAPPGARGEGSGIRGMRERALLIGAAITITHPAQGTEVVLDIPDSEILP